MHTHPLLHVSRYCTKRQIGWLFIWPVCALLLCIGGALWLAEAETTARIQVDRTARKEADTLASAYALQLSHTVDQIDQNLLNLKYFLEHVPQAVKLTDLARKRLYPPEKNVYVSVFDQQGRLVDSTIDATANAGPRPTDLLAELSANPQAGLAITKHDSAPGIARPTVWFSRRLEKPNGDFAGIVTVAVEPRFLGSFYDRTALGRGDFVTVRSTTGTILSTKMGEQIRSYTGIFRKPPVFSQPRGVTLYPASIFNDNEARLFAWDTLERYPLISTVGLLEKDIHSALLKTIETKRRAAIAVAIVIAIAALAALLATMAWLRHRHLDGVSRKRYLLAIENGNEGFFSMQPCIDQTGTTTDFIISECNEQGAAMLGQEKSAMTGQMISRFCSAEEFPALLAKYMQAMDQGSYEDEFWRADANGTCRVLNRYLIRSASGIALTLRDVSELKNHEAQLHHFANRDALTNTYNRHWFMANMPAALGRASARQEQLALLFIDLDNFKDINNTYGHQAGDALLVSTCERFGKLIRPQDQVVRLGGDEFTIILHGLGRDEIVDVADRLIDSMMQPFVIDDVPVDIVRASIGIAVFPEDGTEIDTLVRCADEAMYAVKRAGKSRYRFYDACLQS